MSVANNTLVKTPPSVRRAQVSPFRAPQEEMDKFKKGLDFLKYANLRPSVVADIKGKLYPSVQQVDDLFASALEKYKKNLTKATGLDALVVPRASLYPKTYSAAKGASDILNKYSPDVVVIREISFPFLAIFGVFWGLYHEDALVKKSEEECKSKHRKDWAIHLSIEEEHRLSDSIKLIKRRATVLATEIETDSLERGIFSLEHIEEIRQIDQLMRSLTGNELVIKRPRESITANRFLSNY